MTRLKTIETLAQPYMDEATAIGLDEEGMREVRRASMGAIDSTTSPSRSCNSMTGACIDCSELSRYIGRTAQVCEELPDDVQTYTEPDRSVRPTLGVQGGAGAFY